MLRRFSTPGLYTRLNDPICPSEFLDQLSRIWRPQEASGKPTKIGLCVSGGPDSMALAFLFHQLKSRGLGPKLDLKAFIVDHSHRPDSRKEAVIVSGWLKELGEVSCARNALGLTDEKFEQPTNFESVARTLRYRALAYGSLEHGIGALFLGHHLSDQVETILFRLMRNVRSKPALLRGMEPVSKIPCCYHIFGASDGLQTSSLTELLGNMPNLYPTSEFREHLSTSSSASKGSSCSSGINVSHGGIQMYRPLLSFPKSRLIATCEANGVPFVTDSSNFDPKTTPRNAIRLLLSTNKLPMALRHDSILRLSAILARSRESQKEILTKLMSATRLIRFDLRSGLLIVHVPENIVETYEASEQDAATYVDHLLRLVSPLHESTESFHRRIVIARWMFPELRDKNPDWVDQSLDTPSCTAREVLLERSCESPRGVWKLSRRPFRSHEDPSFAFVPAPYYSKKSDGEWSKWTGWDGRYWIRIRTRDPEDVKRFMIRNLRIADMALLNAQQQRLSAQSRLALKAIEFAAPRKIRYTIPLLAKDGRARVLPTFGIEFPSEDSVNGQGESEAVTDKLQWEVRYKDITDTLQLLKTPASMDDVSTSFPHPLSGFAQRVKESGARSGR